tara:strand:- start:718 stop:1347 length:630 start_codon:yes stop_codon:yes gene_type:complete
MAINKDDYKPTALEQVAGHPAVTAAATAVAAGASVGAAIFLPILTGTLAARRHEERLAKFINDVSDDLMGLERRLDELTDAQYQLIGDAVSCALQTVNETKLEYLRGAIRNTLSVEIIEAQTAAVARALRDISAEEAAFLVRTSTCSSVVINGQQPKGVGSISLPLGSDDVQLLSGLTTLGLYGFEKGGFGGGWYKATLLGQTVATLLK